MNPKNTQIIAANTVDAMQAMQRELQKDMEEVMRTRPQDCMEAAVVQASVVLAFTRSLVAGIVEAGGNATAIELGAASLLLENQKTAQRTAIEVVPAIAKEKLQ